MPTKTKLNLGCGGSAAEGWLNLDREDRPGVDVLWNLNETPLPFEDNRFEEVYSHHVLEHFLPQRLILLLAEIKRILKPGGRITGTIPDLWGCCENILAGKYVENAMGGIYGGAGAGYEPPESHIHLWGWTAITLREILESAGFVICKIQPLGDEIRAIDFDAEKPEGR